MATIKIKITEYFFDTSEILVLETEDYAHKFILDIDTIIDNRLILECVCGYYIKGSTGGLVRNKNYTPWCELPISSDDALDACKWSNRVSRRTYTKIDNPDQQNPTIVSKEMIE